MPCRSLCFYPFHTVFALVMLVLGRNIIDKVVVLEDDIALVEMRYFWVVGDVDQDGDGLVVDQVFFDFDAGEDVHVVEGGYHH